MLAARLALRHGTLIFTPASFTAVKSIPLTVRSASTDAKLSFYDKYLGPASVIASPSFKSRWLVAVPACLTHMCIGAPYAWSVLAEPLSRELGFVVSSADDWGLGTTAVPMSILFALHGISAAIAAKWQIKHGPRTSIGLAGLCFGGGFMLTSAGVLLHNFPLICGGFGILSGCGLGLAYTPPIQCLMDWFPDRKGVASGLTIMGFGSGALVFTPVAGYLMKKMAVLPTFMGGLNSDVILENGRYFMKDVSGKLVEVVNANSSDIARLPFKLTEGYYAVGSGSTGVAATLAITGLCYSAIMLTSAVTIRKPHQNYLDNFKKFSPKSVDERYVELDQAMRTPQFYALAASLMCIASGGMGFFAVAKTMMSDTFGGALPSVVTATFCSSFIMMLACGNLSGRIIWASVSDKIGRPATLNMFALGSCALYLSLPALVSVASHTGSTLPLITFCGASALTISFFGGIYSILPAYEADIFGAKYVGAIHGRMLLASTCAALLGPSMLLSLRNHSQSNAIYALIDKIDPSALKEKFGDMALANLDQLISSKTITISKLMEIVPEGIPDPTPFIYNTPFYAMSSLMAMAALAHYTIKPLPKKYFKN